LLPVTPIFYGLRYLGNNFQAETSIRFSPHMQVRQPRSRSPRNG
jgi:hypothetical protein